MRAPVVQMVACWFTQNSWIVREHTDTAAKITVSVTRETSAKPLTQHKPTFPSCDSSPVWTPPWLQPPQPAGVERLVTLQGSEEGW